MVDYSKHKNAIVNLFEGVAKVIVRKSVKNPITKVTELKEVEQISFKCRLSFDKGQSNEELGAVTTIRTTTLFVPTDIKILEGSRIEVTQAGETFKLKTSGIPAVYSSHREYPVEQWVKWQ